MMIDPVKNAERQALARHYDELCNLVCQGRIESVQKWRELPWGDPRFIDMLAPRLFRQHCAAVKLANVQEWAKEVGLQVNVVYKAEVKG